MKLLSFAITFILVLSLNNSGISTSVSVQKSSTDSLPLMVYKTKSGKEKPVKSVADWQSKRNQILVFCNRKAYLITRMVIFF